MKTDINKVNQDNDNENENKISFGRRLINLLKGEIFAYLIVGVCTTIVSWAAKFLFNYFVYDNPLYPTAFQNFVLSSISWVAGVIFAFFTNRKFVFKSNGPIVKEAVMFVLSRVSTWILDIVVMQVLGTWLGINVYIATLISAVLVTVANYVFSKIFVFNKKSKES